MRKRILVILTALALCCCFALTACGLGESSISRFEDRFATVTTPITVESKDIINSVYNEYYLLSEDDRRGVSDKKDKLDEYAALCNAIITVMEKTERVQSYTAYTKYKKEINAAQAAYNALIALDSSYAADADVTAAKKAITEAESLLAAKDALISAYADAVALIDEFNPEKILFSDWVGQIAAAQTAYEALGGENDDIVWLEDVAAVRVELKSYITDKAALNAIADYFGQKVTDAKKLFSDTFAETDPAYNLNINAAIDTAEEARLAAEAAGLTNDIVTDAARNGLSDLHTQYDGIRYTYEFNAAMSTVASDMLLPSRLDNLKKSLTKADGIYNKIPEADLETVATEKELYDSAVAKLPELEAKKSYIDAVASIKVETITNMADITAAITDSETKYTALVEDFAYTTGDAEVDKATGEFDAKKVDATAAEEFLTAVSLLPTDVTNTGENYTFLRDAEALYNNLTGMQKSYAIVKNAYVRFHNADVMFDSSLTPLLSAEAKFENGEIVPAGLQVFAIDATSGTIQSEGAIANYLQVLYTVSSVKTDGVVVNGKVPAVDGANVADPEFDEYISSKFQYVYTIYDNVTGMEMGKIKKDLHYSATEQVPSLLELQNCLPIYHSEPTTRAYNFTVGIELKPGNPELGSLLLDSEVKRSTEPGTLAGSLDKRKQLSNEKLVTLESPDEPAGAVQWGRYFKAVSTSAVIKKQFLGNSAVGAFDIYFYKGYDVNERNLIDWVRVVKDAADTENKRVKNYRGSSLESKFPDLDIKSSADYNAAGVDDLTSVALGVDGNTKRGWLVDNGANYGNCFSYPKSLKVLLKNLGLNEDSAVTIVAKLRVNDTSAATGITDSELSVPVTWMFTK